MPAYARGDLSVEGYLLRILAALCRQSGGELRVSGAEVDRVGEPTSLTKEWDPDHQQLVIRVESIAFREVFRLTPERQTPKQPMQPVQTLDPLDKLFIATPQEPKRGNGQTEEFLPKSSTLDDPARLASLEQRLQKRRIAAMLREELARKRVTPPES